MFLTLEERLRDAVAAHVKSRYDVDIPVVVETPKQSSFGELALPVSMALAKSLGLTLAACRIEVIVHEGGIVKTESGNFECTSAEQPCFVDVTDIFFNEKYMAQPDEGMVFAGWKTRHRGFCGGSTDPCVLHTAGFEGNDDLMPFLENPEEVFYLEATFSEAGGSLACEFTQSTPGGEFETCVVAPNLTAESCQELADDTFGGAAELTSKDCVATNPEGLCSTPVGDFYYHNLNGQDFATGCSFMSGEWTDL